MVELAQHMDVAVERTSKTNKGELKSVWEVKRNGELTVGITTDEFTPSAPDARPTFQQIAFARNSRNSFRVRKLAADRPWFMEDFSENLREADDKLDRSLRIPTIPLFALMVFGEFLPEWYQESTFSLTDAAWDDSTAGRRFAANFQYSWPSGKIHKNAYWPRSGTLYLRPDLMWSIEEFKVEMVDESDPSKRQFAWSQKNELKALADGFPAAVTAALSADSSTEGPVETRWRFTRFKQGTVPEREFTLAAFDLPEVKGHSSEVRKWLLVANATAVLCILVAIYLRRRSRRQATLAAR
jgi:hypothetical protein